MFFLNTEFSPTMFHLQNIYRTLKVHHNVVNVSETSKTMSLNTFSLGQLMDNRKGKIEGQGTEARNLTTDIKFDASESCIRECRKKQRYFSTK